MRLYEFESKRLLAQAGFLIPKGRTIDSASWPGPGGAGEMVGSGVSSAMVKAQVLSGRRGKSGGVLSCTDATEVQRAVSALFREGLQGVPVTNVLVEERLEIAREYYLCITYQHRRPVVIAASEGGVDIEEVRHAYPDRLAVQPVSLTTGIDEAAARSFLEGIGFGEDAEGAARVFVRLFKFFLDVDALLVEVNPLILTPDGRWYVADAKIELDDEAAFRTAHLGLPERSASGRAPTALEQLAHRNDLIDSRGAAGRMFYEIEDGNIIILAAGGGTSSEALDALFLLGGRPAIFTEHSGNPTADKVKGITRIALECTGAVDAIWVIGGRANFTDIYETLVGGVMTGIRECESFDKSLPIVIRRAGPRDEEAFEALRAIRETEGYNIYLRGMATSVYESARMVIYLANKHHMARKRVLP